MVHSSDKWALLVVVLGCVLFPQVRSDDSKDRWADDVEIAAIVSKLESQVQRVDQTDFKHGYRQAVLVAMRQNLVRHQEAMLSELSEFDVRLSRNRQRLMYIVTQIDVQGQEEAFVSLAADAKAAIELINIYSHHRKELLAIYDSLSEVISSLPSEAEGD